MRDALNATRIQKKQRNCCSQTFKKATKPLSTGISAPRGKYFYLSVNCNFDINSCEAQFTSKWGQTVDARFVHPPKLLEDDKASNSELTKFLFGSLFPLFQKYFPNILILFVSRMNSQNTLLVAKIFLCLIDVFY